MPEKKHEFIEKVRARIRKLKLKYIKKFYRKYFSLLPHNCVYNHQQKQHRKSTGEVLVDPDTLKPVTVGLCLYGVDDPTQWKGDLCFLPETAENCPLFSNRYEKNQITKKLEEELSNPQIRAEKYKDLHELYLLLDEENSTHNLKEDIIESLNLIDLSDIFGSNGTEKSKRKSKHKKSIHRKSPQNMNISKTEEKPAEVNLEQLLQSYKIADLRKVAQLAISLIDKKTKKANIPFDKKSLEKEVWGDEFDNDDPFFDGL